jgi:hypothetical protein
MVYFGHVDGGKGEGGKLWRPIVEYCCGGGGGGAATELADDVEGEDNEEALVDVSASSGNTEAAARVGCWKGEEDTACSL